MVKEAELVAEDDDDLSYLSKLAEEE